MILSLQTTTFSAYGGIPSYNRSVCRALNESDFAEVRVLIATDPPKIVRQHSSRLPRLALEGFSGRRTAFVTRIAQLALSKELDLLLIGHVNYAPLGLLLKIVRPNLRYGVMVHGIEVWSRLPPIKRYALQQADFITSVSEFTRKRIVEVNGVHDQRVYLLPNTIEWDIEEICDNQPLPGSGGGLNLLSVCRLESNERYKGIDTVIKALPRIIEQVPELKYFIVGSGSDLQRHKELAAATGVAEHVHFVGSVDPATLLAYYKRSDVFVMPSAGEGFGIVFLEAMRYAKPIVAANSGAAAEVIANGETGLLINYDNVKQFAEAVTKLCQDKEMRERLGRRGYQRLKEKFSFGHFSKTLGDILIKELPRRESVGQQKPTLAKTPETVIR